jgi:hypothetical protein
MTSSQIDEAARLARANVQTFLDHRNAFTLGWCAAFVQGGLVYVVQRPHRVRAWA